MLNIAALTKLRDYLNLIDKSDGEVSYGGRPVSFDLGQWFGTDVEECGFAACAIGHGILAGIIPGVIISEQQNDTQPFRYSLDIESPEDLKHARIGANFTLRDSAEGTASGSDTARRFLGMGEPAFRYCFYFGSYPERAPGPEGIRVTPAMVAEHIQDVLDGRF